MIEMVTKQHTGHCEISGKFAVGHAPNIKASCGAINSNGTRCDARPHPRWVRHHACGETWEIHW